MGSFDDAQLTRAAPNGSQTSGGSRTGLMARRSALLSCEPRLSRRAAASARATVWRAQARQGSGRGRIGDACRGSRTLIPNHYLAPLQQPQGSDSRKEKGRLSRPEKFREGGRAPRVGALSMREEWLTDRKSRTRLPRRCEIAKPVLYCLFGCLDAADLEAGKARMYRLPAFSRLAGPKACD